MVRPLMAKHKLVLFPSLSGVPTMEVVQTKNGTATHTTIMVEYTLASVTGDGEVADIWPEKLAAYGEATDNGDKGFYKASTGANKYMVLRLFQLAAGDDPERAGAGDAHEMPVAARRTARQPPNAFPDSGPPPSEPAPPEDGNGEIDLGYVEGIEADLRAICAERGYAAMGLELEAKRQQWFSGAANPQTRTAVAAMHARLAADLAPGGAP